MNSFIFNTFARIVSISSCVEYLNCSIGTAGVPGAGLIMLSIVMAQVGLPLEAIAVVAGIDRILDMARTSVNVAGDLMVTTLVGKSEGELNEEIYNRR